MPESPVYLIEKGKLQEAVASLRWLRGQDADITGELETVEQIVAGSKQIGNIGVVALLTNKIYLVPFLLSIMLMFFQQFSGVNAVTFYAVQIFSDAGSDISSDAAIYMGLVQVMATVVAILTLDRLGRKILFIFANIFSLWFAALLLHILLFRFFSIAVDDLQEVDALIDNLVLLAVVCGETLHVGEGAAQAELAVVGENHPEQVLDLSHEESGSTGNMSLSGGSLSLA